MILLLCRFSVIYGAEDVSESSELACMYSFYNKCANFKEMLLKCVICLFLWLVAGYLPNRFE